MILIIYYRLYIHGGVDVTGREAEANQLWFTDLSHDQPEWHCQSIPDPNLVIPSKKRCFLTSSSIDGLYRHTIHVINDDQIVIIGG